MKTPLIVTALFIALTFTSCSQDDPSPLTKGERSAADLQKYLNDNPEIQFFFCHEYNSDTGKWDAINSSSTAADKKLYSISGQYFTIPTGGSIKESFNLAYLVRFEHNGDRLNLYFSYDGQ